MKIRIRNDESWHILGSDTFLLRFFRDNQIFNEKLEGEPISIGSLWGKCIFNRLL